jgi:hypothetical protein
MMGYQAKALDVVWGNASGNPVFTDGSGNPLAIGDLVEVGADSAGTIAGFTIFAPSAGGVGYEGDNTSLGGTWADEASTPGSSTFFSKPIYIAVFNGTTVGNSTDEALLKNTAWTFAADDSGSTAIDVSDAGTTIVLGATYVTGGTVSGALAGADAIELVPEPSSIALVAMGLFGGIAMIRRRR